MWGVAARFKNTARPAMSLPTATSSGCVAARASGDEMRSPRETSWRTSFGTSTPTADFPGIGARIRTSVAAIEYAMSRFKLVTFATLTPDPSSSSKRVTVGPTVIPTSRVSTPCDARDSSNSRPRSATRALFTSCTSVSPSKSVDGNTHTPGTAGAPTADSSVELAGRFEPGFPTNSGVTGSIRPGSGRRFARSFFGTRSGSESAS